jgi:hypothetical protein
VQATSGGANTGTATPGDGSVASYPSTSDGHAAGLTSDVVHASEIANMAAALAIRLPYTPLGAARVVVDALPKPCVPPSSPSGSNDVCAAAAAAPTPPDVNGASPDNDTPARPRQFIELTRPNVRHEAGGVVWLPDRALGSHAACTQQMSLRVLLYAGEGSGGDGLRLALGRFTSDELLQVLATANGTMGTREPLTLRLKRQVGLEGSIELWCRGELVWSSLQHTNASQTSAFPAARWTSVHLVFSASFRRINLAVDGVTHLLDFTLPHPAINMQTLGVAGWRLGVAASTFERGDRHAVADARCSCSDGRRVDVPFTVSADGWHFVRPTAAAGSDPGASSVAYEQARPLVHRPFRYYREPVLRASAPELGHIEGGSLVRVSGTFPDRGVDYYCGFNESMELWTPATWSTDGAMTCRSPAVDSARSAPLRLSLNGQQLSVSALTYRFFSTRVSEYNPTSGPVRGGTILHIRGESLQVASTDPLARCAFNGTLQTPATWVDSDVGPGYLRCETPRTLLTDSVPMLFSISLNGQDLSADVPPFSFFYIYFGGFVAGDAPPPPPPRPLGFEEPPSPPSPPPLPGGPRPEGLAVRYVNRRSGPVEGGSGILVTIWDVPLASASEATYAPRPQSVPLPHA